MLFLSLCIIAASGLLPNGVFSQEPERNVSKIERFIYDRCRTYSSEAAAYDNVKTHFTQFSDFLSYTASLLPNGKEQFCKDERPKLNALMGQLAKDMKPCFPLNEKYLPRFMYDSFSEFLNFVCADRNVENFFSTQGSECRTALKTQQAGQEVGHCFKKLFAVLGDRLGKEDLCLDLKLSQTCFGEAIARHCSNFAGYESLNSKFFSAIRKPCNSALHLGISSLILVIAFITTKIVS